MKTYKKYKPSGVEWIGDIPEHWEMVKLKYIGKSLIGLSYKPDDIVEDESKGLLVLRSSNIQKGKLSLEDNVYVNCKIKDDIIVREGDILLCSRNGSRSLIGKNITISKELEGNTFGVFMTIFRSNYSNFLSKVFNSMIFTNQSGLFLTSTINQLTQDTLNNFIVPFVHLKIEQKKIVQFLDEKTEIIDKLISTKERKIELLKEQRTSLINQVITKGLDPDVKRKDSGVEWIGEIPEHWEYIKIGYVSDLITGNPWKSDLFDFEEGTKIVRGENVSEGFLRWGERTRFWKNEIVKGETYFLKEGDIIVSMDGSKVGKNYVLIQDIDLPLLLHQRMCRIRSSERINPVFLNYFIGSGMFRYYIDLSKTDPMIPHITQKDISDFKFSLPPMSEQKQVVEYLNTHTKEIDDLIVLEQQKIDLLKEYRQSLISEVITGKIDVTNLN